MSYRAIVEFSFSMDSFRNVGMFQQGIYFLTYEIYYYKENKKIYATPYANIPFIYSEDKGKGMRNLQPSEILENQPIFKTRSFCIRYRHEEIPMNEVCQFRAEVDTDKEGSYLDTKFYIETNLCFLRYKFTSSVGSKFMRKFVQERRNDFKVVSTQEFKISGALNGITKYLPTTFKGVYFSVAHGLLHTALIDFKWRDSCLAVLDIDKDFEENGIYIETERKLTADEADKMMQDYSFRPDSLKDYLFSSEGDFYVVKYNKKTLEYIFDTFISPLILNWENLKRMYETVLSEERESISNKAGAHFKIEKNCENLEFCGHNSWKRFTKEEDKIEDKENSYVEKEQADLGEDSDEEGNCDVGEEFGCVQKIYSSHESFKEFYLNYTDLKEAFVKYIYTKNPNTLIKNIENEFRILAGQILQCNYDLMMLLGSAPEEIREHFREKYCQRLKEKVEDSVFRSHISTSDFVINSENDSKELYKIMAEKRRSNIYEELIEDPPIEDLTNLTHDTTPVMIEEIFTMEEHKTEFPSVTRATKKRLYKDGLHLFVLAHGFQATHIDMQEIKNHIAMIVPNSIFLCSESNEGVRTEGCLIESGRNLAGEVFDFFDDEEDCGHEVTKISFIGHSMGGVIIRSALPHLEKFKHMFHGLCTLSSPHLGYAACNNKLINVGLWAFQTWKRQCSIEQLSMTDAKDIEDTFMYKLSKKKGLKWFKHVMLFSSIQDGYVTFDSSRIQIFKNTTLYDPIREMKYREMASNIFRDCDHTTVTRVDVNFSISNKSIDSMIGRKAHVSFLSNSGFLTMFTNRFKETLFDQAN
ncbi:unnamed protein product [Moneuplotes crassus]|uniref:DUF676 domain-containing protein n=1 Tax=Euplotes crassus TaxID=5936 RepID=A0AAD1Y4P0_EUPCR|nr:unnamed protein product [Moneuplotes crassus]